MIQLTTHMVLGGCRGYSSIEERTTDMTVLRGLWYDHFVEYRDTQAPIGLCYSKTPKARMAELDAIGPLTLDQQSERRRLEIDLDRPRRREERSRPWSPKPGDRGYDLLC